MISYTDGKHIATFDECGALTEFRAVAFRGAPDDCIGGKEGKRMIAQLRQPKLRSVDGCKGMRMTRPV